MTRRSSKKKFPGNKGRQDRTAKASGSADDKPETMIVKLKGALEAIKAWVPPEDWGNRVLVESLADHGESQTLETLSLDGVRDGAAIANHVEKFVQKSRSSQNTCFPQALPLSVIVLACLKHRSPLPAEVWRLSIFGKVPQQTPK
jgi:hypothetical protein